MDIQGTDSKKDQFRKYLEQSGVVDALTKVLVGLYEEAEKPANPLEFIKEYLGTPQHVDVEALQNENKELKKQLEELKNTNDELTKKMESMNIAEEEKE